MKKKEIFIVIGLVIMGLVHLSIKKGGVFSNIKERFSGKQYTLLDKDFPNSFSRPQRVFEGIESLKLENVAGSIQLSASEDEKISVVPEIIIYNSNKDEADKIQKSVKLHDYVDGEELFLSSYEKKNFSLKRVRIKYNIKVPDNVSVELSNRFGDITIYRTGAFIKSYNSIGNTIISDINNANLFASNKRGEIIVKDLKGRVSIYGKHSPTIIKDVQGDLDLKLYRSNLEAYEVLSEIFYIDSQYASVSLNNIAADMVTIKSKKGTVDFSFKKETKKISIVAYNSGLNLYCPQDVIPDLNAEIKSGEIVIKDFPEFSLDKGETRSVGVISGEDTSITISGQYSDLLIKRVHTSTGFNVKTI